MLAAVGVYSVAAYAAIARSREIGIRIVLGATSSDAAKLMLLGGWRVLAAGLVAGAGLSWAAARALSAFLFGVSARDPLTLALVPAALALMALAATYVPARRAGTLDPMVALRVE